MIKLVLFLLGALIPGLFAQDIPARVQESEAKQETQEQAQKAVGQAKSRQGLEEGPEVTYAQVLADPDNIELNYRYARTQVKQGNLRSAAATLERILMVNPELPKVRLFYAVVLFRLDTLDDAERELDVLRRENMPASLRAELDEYLRLIHQRRRSTHFTALLGAGLDYDDNRNAAPATGQRLFFDIPVTLDPNSRRKNDISKTMLGSLGMTHDLGFQAGHSLFLDYSYYRAEQTNQRTLNLQAHTADAGLVYKTPWVKLTSTLEFSHILLTQTTYIRNRGGRFRMDFNLTPRFVTFIEGAYARQVYNRTLVVPTGDDRTGDHLEGTFGATYDLAPTMSLMGSYGHGNQGALDKSNAFRRDSFTLTDTWLLGHGQFLLTTAAVNIDQYERADITVSKTKRIDDIYRARATYGVPLSIIAKPLRHAVLTIAYEYYQAISSHIPNFSYSNNKFSTMLTYKWGI